MSDRLNYLMWKTLDEHFMGFLFGLVIGLAVGGIL